MLTPAIAGEVGFLCGALRISAISALNRALMQRA